MTTGIYKIENIVNGKVYIGQSVDIKRRWSAHKKCKTNDFFHNALRKHPEQFKFSVLLTCSREMLDTWERDMIALYDCIYPSGYNFTNGGGSNTEISDETRRKLSESHRGITHSDETKRKISEAHKGITHSDEAKRKISEAKKGRPGIPHSDETKRKLSESHRGIPHSEEHKRKISESNRGKHNTPQSDETKRKLSEEMKGRTVSDETKRKISEARKEYWRKKKELNGLKIHSNNEKQNK